MSTLSISDLSLDKELDTKAMAEVSGGHGMMKKYPGKGPRYCKYWPRRKPRIVNNTINTVSNGISLFSNNTAGQSGGSNSIDVTFNGRTNLAVFG